MSEEAVQEAMVEQEAPPPVEPVESAEPAFDMDAAADSLAADLFGKKPEELEANKEAEEPEEPVEAEAEATEEVEEPEAEPEPEVEAREAPQSWKKEMHDKWASLDAETQDYIELREKQMREGLDRNHEDSELGKTMRDTFAPYEAMLRSQNISHEQAIGSFLSTHYKLSTAPMEERKQIFSHLAKVYGLEAPTQGENSEQAPVDPRVNQLQNELNGIKQHLSASQQRSLQEARTRIEGEVEAFAKDHPHFDDLSDEIARLIRADYELEDAYKVAYKSSRFYDLDLEKKNKEATEKAEKAKKAEAEKAKKAASVNVKGRDTKKSPTAPTGTMDDTMREVMREIKNRN